MNALIRPRTIAVIGASPKRQTLGNVALDNLANYKFAGRVIPVHAEAPATMPARKYTCSVQLGKNLFHCFQAECAAHGNVLDLWAAVHRLPLYEAALHLAATFHLPTNREEAPVMAAQHPAPQTGAKSTVITANGG